MNQGNTSSANSNRNQNSQNQDLNNQQCISQPSQNINIPSENRPQLMQEQMLVIKIMYGNAEDIGRSFLINSKGLIEGGRQAEDGFVYFGSQEYEDDKLINDVIIGNQEYIVGSRQFYIKYDSLAQKYLMKDMLQGTGTFVKIQFPTRLESGNFVSFGSTNMAVVMSQDDQQISLHFIEGSKAPEVIHFKQNERILIGRQADCSVVFNDQDLSRYQCLIIYSNGWYVMDGNGFEESTNGTCLHRDYPVEIFNEMIIIAGYHAFEVKVFHV